MMETPQPNLLDLPNGALLTILQHLDWLSVLRLSLCSHVAAKRLGAVENLWRDLACCVLELREQQPVGAAVTASPLPRGRAAPPPPAQQQPLPACPGAAECTTAGVPSSTLSREGAGGASHGWEGPREAPHVSQDAAADRHRTALLRLASFTRSHRHSCLRLARLSAGLTSAPPRDSTWQAPGPGAIRLAGMGEACSNSPYALTVGELYYLCACDGSDISVCGVAARCFTAARSPSGAPAKLQVALAHQGRPLAWLYYPVLPARPSWERWPGPAAASSSATATAAAATTSAAEAADGNGVSGLRGQPCNAAGGESHARPWICQAGEAPAYAPEVWTRRGVGLNRLLTGGASDGDGGGSGYGGSSGGRRSIADSGSSNACRKKGAAGVHHLDDVGDSPLAGALSSLLRALVAAGRTRVASVGVISFVARSQLAEAGVPRDMGAMRAAGMQVLDLVGVLGSSGILPATHSPAPEEQPHGRTVGAASIPPAAVPPGADVTAALPRRADPTAPALPGSTPPAVEVEAMHRLGVLEQALQAELRSAAEGAEGGVGSGGGGTAVGERLRAVLSRLPRCCPGVQVLVLPAVLPRAGRAVRKTPTRAGAVKVTAPRLLQLLVPVFSELRLAMTARRPGCAALLPRLRAVLVVLEPEAEPHEAVLRQLVASTLDRCTGDSTGNEEDEAED